MPGMSNESPAPIVNSPTPVHVEMEKIVHPVPAPSPAPEKRSRLRFIADGTEHLIYGSRWILAPLYAGLVLAMALYSYKFIEELYHLFVNINHIEESEVMLSLLNLVDITMVGNLVLMIMIGGYSIFVRKIEFIKVENRPQWLNQINSGTLKVKMGMSLIGVSSIHLLKAFINAEKMEWKTVSILITIHTLFIISTLALGLTDKMLHPTPPPNGDHH